jgi:hypothetical protein
MLNLQSESARTLRNALRANAVFSAISGLIIVFAHAQVLQWLGLSDISIVALGVGLIVFSVYLFWMGSRQELQRDLVTGVIAGDWAWVAASVALLIFKGGVFSTLGLFLVIDVAVVVMVFAIMQQRGLKQLASATD